MDTETGTEPATTSIPLPRGPEDDVDGRVPRLTPGTEPLGPADGDDDRYLVRRADGRVVRMPWLLYRVVTLLDGTRDLEAVADAIGAEDGSAVTAEEVHHAVEQRLVPAGLVIAPPVTRAPVGTPAPRRPRRRAGAVVGLLSAAVVLVAATAAATTLVVRTGATPAAPGAPAAPPPVPTAGVTAPGGIDGPPTLVGRVVDVLDVATAVVDVGGRTLRVDVAGLAPGGTPSCASADARAFAEQTLQGQEVTVVPDPTLPPVAAERWRAYLVLDSQLSYTDAALGAGWATAGESRYRAGYVERQAEAERAGLGQFGPPCRTSG